MNYCVVCGKAMGPELISSLLKIGAPVKPICSVECVNKNSVKEHSQLRNVELPKTRKREEHACCEKAIRRNCFCMISFDCETHGRKCIGTHD